MLCNMALVWLMMYFSICLMIIISICFMIIVSREYFEITFISRKKGLCWPSVWDYLLFDIRSAQSAERFFMIPVSKWYMTFISKWAMRSYFHFEMLYDCHFEMSRKIFVHKIIFVRRTLNILLTKIMHFLLFSYTAFYARLGPYPCVEIKFLEKGDGLLCQILIILQC